MCNWWTSNQGTAIVSPQINMDFWWGQVFQLKKSNKTIKILSHLQIIWCHWLLIMDLHIFARICLDLHFSSTGQFWQHWTCMNLLRHARICSDMHEVAQTCMNLLRYAWICLDLLKSRFNSHSIHIQFTFNSHSIHNTRGHGL